MLPASPRQSLLCEIPLGDVIHSVDFQAETFSKLAGDTSLGIAVSGPAIGVLNSIPVTNSKSEFPLPTSIYSIRFPEPLAVSARTEAVAQVFVEDVVGVISCTVVLNGCSRFIYLIFVCSACWL